MHVWVLETLTRDDEYCYHDSKIVAIYSKSSFQKARKHFKELCTGYPADEYEIERCKNENGYHFNACTESYKGFKRYYVGLIRKELL